MDATTQAKVSKRSQAKLISILLAATLVIVTFTPGLIVSAQQAVTCEYWVAPTGNDANPGTSLQPWATLVYAATQVYQAGGSNCTVWFKDGMYNGSNEVKMRFSTPVTFKAVNPYKAILQNNGPALVVKGGANMVFEGFQFRHATSTAAALVVYTERSGSDWAENITFRNNIFHDSYNNDILKLMDGSRFITVEGNVFYNQAAGEQHIDVNSVTDVTIQDNIFFNDFPANANNTKHFIVIKDSNDNTDGLTGSERINLKRNIFLNWQGSIEAFVQVGNDGKPYYEAKDVRLENNLMIGNAPNKVGAVFGVSGASDVVFVNNTVVGNLPSSAYAFRVITKGLNPLNQNVLFYNNIWSDPTGTMGSDGSSSNDFSDGDPSQTNNLVLDNNLYWNGSAAIPPGDVVSPLADDVHRAVGNPQLNTNQASIVLPRWNGTSFLSGNTTIRQEFERLVMLYGQVPSTSPAVDRSNPLFAPADDILQHPRGSSPDLGAYEAGQGGTSLTATPTATKVSTATPTPIQTATATPSPQTDLIFADNFESGNLSAWSTGKTDGADLTVNTSAALSGADGMQLTLDDSLPIFVSDESPSAERHYRARFYLDPNSMKMAGGESFMLFIGYTPASKATMRLLLGYGNGTFRLSLQTLKDTGIWANSPWTPISDAPHVIELEWRAATQAGANDGSLALWVDGQQLANIARVDNDRQSVERVQLGAVAGIDRRTRGIFYLDDFESRRQTYIGP